MRKRNSPVCLGNVYDDRFGTGFAGCVWDGCEVSPTLQTMQGGNRQPMVIQKETVKIRQATKNQWVECEVGGVADFSYPNSKTRRGRVQGGGGNISPTITANETGICRIEKDDNPEKKSEYRIRRLTPRECWRLMDFSDEDFDKAATVNSNTQLYSQAGNSIVENVLVAIFGQLFEGKENAYEERARKDGNT